jgi:hypothetical protein
MTYMNYSASEDASLLSKPKARVKHRLVQGVGINDSPHPVQVNGKNLKAYSVWGDMLVRCYSASYQKKRPTYIGCLVVEEWHSFTNFEKWFLENYTEGCALDKDILFPDNKIYAPETCVFVPQKLNALLTNHKAARGDCPLGVHFQKSNQKYIAQISTEAGNQYLGCFLTPLEAHRAWQLAKSDNITAAETNDLRVRAALDKRAAQLRDDHAHGRITVTL